MIFNLTFWLPYYVEQMLACALLILSKARNKGDAYLHAYKSVFHLITAEIPQINGWIFWKLKVWNGLVLLNQPTYAFR